MITILGEWYIIPLCLKIPAADRVRQEPDLPACIVDVELPLDVVSRRGEQIREGVAHSRASAVANVKRARGVRAHKLHKHLLALADIGQAVAGAFGMYIKERFVPPVPL